MSHPDLYRSGNASSAGFDKVRYGSTGTIDIKTEGDDVLPNTGGVSARPRMAAFLRPEELSDDKPKSEGCE
ncbi:hypothetical protein K503DRAFT_802894 [Rhizopogon vinicolor AM-OR11-026]|uniref:Uncharacterized protein n=1 Tax=Rhizopogon vinicolor AM-OR11-026 TaxID=1314800 RepID=A0A1B7MRV4_9AGAM|nr:hypothetical protein K503DRAFT_802894 [Rhizopogon vinicolor AM-OR11-026]